MVHGSEACVRQTLTRVPSKYSSWRYSAISSMGLCLKGKILYIAIYRGDSITVFEDVFVFHLCRVLESRVMDFGFE